MCYRLEHLSQERANEQERIRQPAKRTAGQDLHEERKEPAQRPAEDERDVELEAP